MDAGTSGSPLAAFEDSELVFGLVAPVGTDLGRFEAGLADALAGYRYRTRSTRLSELATPLLSRGGTAPTQREADALTRKMDAGNEVRSRHAAGLALAAAAAINAGREIRDLRTQPMGRVAHVLRSLKHPEEVLALRRIYGAGFYLLGVVSTDEERSQTLKRKGCTEEEIAALRARDDYEGLAHGQRTRDTFHLADAFVGLDDGKELRRFLDLVFSAPHETPSADEHAMFLAFSAALRSGDLSRQVGAVVVSAGGDVIAVGANDVPRAGGGLHWPDARDHRDFRLGRDFNEYERDQIIDEVLERLCPDGMDLEAWKAAGRKSLRGSSILDITEYGRPVHAEMEALLAAGRSGISAVGATIYCTTFPCHNCAKHLIDAGLRRVVYVEPYPKSKTASLYAEEVRMGSSGEGDDPRVLFEPFRGVGPRRFFDLFSMNLGSGYSVRRKVEGGVARSDWVPARGEARVPLLPSTYLLREGGAARDIERLFAQDPGG